MSLRVSPSLNYLFPARQREERPDLPGNDTHPTAGMSQEQLLQKPSGLLLTFPCPLIPGRATLLNSGTSQSLGPLSSFPRSSLARQQPVSSCFTSLWRICSDCLLFSSSPSWVSPSWRGQRCRAPAAGRAGGVIGVLSGLWWVWRAGNR